MHRRVWGFMLISWLGMGCSYIPFLGSSVPEEEIRSDYNVLFNGGSLSEWVVMGNPEGFQVVNDVIHSDGGKGGNWLRSKKEYADFVLRLEYRVSPGGNSGVFLRCTEQGNPWETGYECQISNEQPPRDDLHCTGSLYGYVAAAPRPDESPEVWHTYEIMCKQKRILVFVDGHRTVNINTDEAPALQNKPASGYIGLQDSHTGEGMWVEYRNIRFMELKTQP